MQIIWHFPLRSDGVAYSLTHLHSGDRGAAIGDAVKFAVEQLQSEPGEFRRIVLLVSQEKDEGSAVPYEDTLRTLGKASTVIYSLTFATPREKRKPNRGRHGKEHAAPLAETVDAMRDHTGRELAAYTGGVHLSFSMRRDFDEDIKAIAADIRNRSTLTFQPKGHEPGLHLLKVKVFDGRTVTARGGYWFEPVRSDP